MNPIQSVKHVVDSSGALTNTASVTTLLKTVPVTSTTFDPIEVQTGEKVNGLFLSFYAIGSTGAPLAGPIDWYIAKSHTGQFPVSIFPDPGATGLSTVRNQIFHEEKGLSGSGDGTPMVFKGVIAIPRGMRRMRQDDNIFIKAIVTGSDVVNFCIKAIYKSYS